MSTPRFSIVIPTRNRARYLQHAIRCAASQVHESLEIIVSDNDSADETRAVVEPYLNGRTRYVNTGRTLCMPDSWEFALAQARGEFVTVLSDDDAISPELCDRIERAIGGSRDDLYQWPRHRYVLGWEGTDDTDTLYLPDLSGEFYAKSAAAMLDKWYGVCRYIKDSPMMFNCFAHRDLLARVRRRCGRVFIGMSPDVAAGVALLAHTRAYVYFDAALALAGIGVQSIGCNCVAGGQSASNVDTFFAEFGKRIDELYAGSPHIDADLLTPAVASVLTQAKPAHGGALADHALDLDGFFTACLAQVVEFERGGRDVGDKRAALARSAEAHGVTLDERAAEAQVEHYAQRRTVERRHAFGGFADIFECATQLPGLEQQVIERGRQHDAA